MRKILAFLTPGLTLLFSFLMVTSNLRAEGTSAGATVRILYSNLGGDSYPNQISSFDMLHVRPHWKGSFLEDNLKYKLLLGFDKNFKNAVVLDAYGDYKIFDFMSIRFGQYKVPFDRQFLTALSAMQFINRGTGGLKPFQRDRGATIRGRIAKAFLGYDFGVFNGTKMSTDFNAKNNSGKDTQKHLFAGRVSFDPQGEYGYKLALPGKADELKTTVGFGFAGGQINDDTTDVAAFCFDIAGRMQGITTMFEYQNTRIKNPVKTTTTGITAQAGYFVLNELEPVARYSTKKIKDGDTVNEMTFGVNYYFVGNNAKLQINYTRLESEAPNSAKSADNEIFLLYQLVF
ncbi:hypothetical protein JXJ21_24155 [candidate division KSB1 bacterium]|nr:hypothetical protein [candidate division KSB1 bacterium]